MLRRFVLTGCLVALATGCAPSLSPLYRDYDIESPTESTQPESVDGATGEPAGEPARRAVYARIREALAEAGWTEAPPSAPNVVSTTTRQLSNWGLYRVVVTLDVVPVGDRYVRVLFHPMRRYFTGARSKIPYLDGGMRRALLPKLNEAFEAHGLYPIGTPRERDEDQVAGT